MPKPALKMTLKPTLKRQTEMKLVLAFFLNNIGNEHPMVVNTSGHVINAFHLGEVGRGGYMPPGAGTSEGSFLVMKGLAAYCLNTPDYADKHPGLDSLLQLVSDGALSLFPTTTPGSSTQYWLPHWLVLARGTEYMEGPTAPEFDASGYLLELVPVTDGVCVVPDSLQGDRLSRVHRAVIDEGDGVELEWQNLYSGIRHGVGVDIEYFVNMHGFLLTPDGSATKDHNEPVGTIKLTSNITDDVYFNFTVFQETQISTGTLFDAWPLWFSDDVGVGHIASAVDSLHWGIKGFDEYHKLYPSASIDGYSYKGLADQLVGNYVQLSLENTRDNHIIKTDMIGPNWWQDGVFMGVRSLLNERDTTMAITRITDDILEITSDDSTSYASGGLDVQDVEVEFNTDTHLKLNVSIDNRLEVILIPYWESPVWWQCFKRIYSLADLSQHLLYPEDFVASNCYLWYAEVDPHLYSSYSGGDSSVSFTEEALPLYGTVDPREQVINTSKFEFNVSDWAGVVIPFLSPLNTSEEIVLLSQNSGAVRIQVEDADGWTWSYHLPEKTTLSSTILDWDSFVLDSYQENTGDDPESMNLPDTLPEFHIRVDWGVEFINLGMVSTTANPPAWFDPTDVVIDHFRFVATPLESFTMRFGVCTIENLPHLAYYPGVMPFTADFEFVSDVLELKRWRGPAYTGYQSFYPWYRNNDTARAELLFRFFRDAQADYNNRIGELGPFSPVYIWNRWDGLAYGASGFGWDGPDPNTFWGGFQARASQELAQGLYYFKDTLPSYAPGVMLSNLQWLEQFMRDNGARVPTTFPRDAPAYREYDEPHIAANFLKSVIYYEQAIGANPTTAYLRAKLYINIWLFFRWSGAYEGTFTTDGVYYGFWHGEILEALTMFAL